MAGGLGDAAKAIQKLIAAEETIPVRQQIIDLQTAFLGFQSDYAQLQNENHDHEKKIQKLENEISALKESANISARLKRDPGKEWLLLEDDPDGDARYCMLCWDNPQRDLYRLFPGKDRSGHEYDCLNCKHHFGKYIGESQVYSF